MSRTLSILGAASGLAGAVDEAFENVTLLLTGDGTNGAQNNTFFDSSANNFSITRFGNVTQGNFSPFGNRWSNYFPGPNSASSLTFTDPATLFSAAFNFGVGDFTVELFVRPEIASGVNSTMGYVDFRGNSYTENHLALFQSGGVFRVERAASPIISGGSVSTNQFTHVALVRRTGTLTLYLNGTSVGSTSDTTSYGNSYARVGRLAEDYPASNPGMFGNISNVRVVKGTALYTANFTPPTAPLTAVPGTSLLTCQSNRFIDNSANNFAITRNGDVSVQRFSPFAPSAVYNPATDGASAYFDGSGDYLQLPTTFPTFSGDFTVELWVYRTSASNQGDFVAFNRDGGTGVCSIQIYSGTTGSVVALLSTNGSSQTTLSYSNIAIANQWNHIAVTRSGSTVRLFVNGVSSGSTATVSGALYSGSTTNYVGFGNFEYLGYMSGLRVVQGTALYTSNFTPPTAPLNPITNTSLLLNFTNAGIADASGMNVLETVGNAQVSTVVKKYGTGAMAFDGNGDWLQAPASSSFALRNTFTVEMWIYRVGTAVQWLVGNNTGSGNDAWLIEIEANNTVYAGGWTVGTQTTATVPSGAWCHLALVCNAGTLSLYLNGVQSGTPATGMDFSSANALFVGSMSGGARGLSGYIDDLRITKGVARYLANFTPPTAPLPLR
jgi:hypothetical protein